MNFSRSHGAGVDAKTKRARALSRLTLAAVAAVSLAGMTEARAILIDFESASGYVPGNLYSQPGVPGATAWGATSSGITYGPLSVTSGAGVGGSQGLVAVANANVVSSVYQFNPTSTDLGGVFSNNSSQIAFSFQLSWDAFGTADFYGRFFVGNTLSAQGGDVLKMSWSADGRLIYTLSDNSVRYATAADGSAFRAAGTGTFYTISGLLDYSTKTYSLAVNGVQQTNGSGSTTIAFVNAAGSNVNPNFEVSTLFNNNANFKPWTVDNISYALVPEPSALLLGAVGLSVVFLFRRRRCSV